MENGNAADRSRESPCVSFSWSFFRGMLMNPTRPKLEIPYLLGHNCNSSTRRRRKRIQSGLVRSVVMFTLEFTETAHSLRLMMLDHHPCSPKQHRQNRGFSIVAVNLDPCKERMLRSFAAMQWLTWWFTARGACATFCYPPPTSTRHLYLARNFKSTFQANSRSTAHLPIKSDHALQAENDVRSEQPSASVQLQ